MSLIDTKKIGNTVVEIYDDCIPKNEKELRDNIKIIYDEVNKISKNLKLKDINKLFYKESELKKVEFI